ncbi:MAG TPA: PAS domain S-box protein [Bacillaceae bacterium]
MLESTALLKHQSFDEASLYKAFIEQSGDLYSVHSKDGQFMYASPSSLGLLGFEPEELLSMSLQDLCHPEDKVYLENPGYNKTTENRQYYRIRRKEGDYIWFETSCNPVASSQDSVMYVLISRDVTKFKAAEKELKESKDKYRLLLENFQDTVGLVTKEGFFIHINNTGKKLFGITHKEEIVGQCLIDYIHPSERKSIKEHMVPYGQKDPAEYTVLRSDSQLKHVEIKMIPTVYKERETYQIVIRDLTDRIMTEYIMQRTEKLSVVGQLAAGIAHEIRNPLTVIKGFTQLLKQDKSNQYLDVVMIELERVENIVSDLLFLAKPQLSIFDKVDIQKLLEGIITLFYSESLLHKIEIRQDIRLHDPIITGEADKLKQVYINLIKNSMEAMPNGGTIRITAEQTEDGMVRTQVIDEGTGISEDSMKKLKEPFFSTKEKGTGLGLMICNQIIKNHRGLLKIESKENEGTTTTILLPRHISIEKTDTSQ